MRCEHQNGCGFYNYLASRGMLVNESCGKENITVCPRYREASGEGLSPKEKGVLRVPTNESVYTQDGPLTHEETSIAYRRTQ